MRTRVSMDSGLLPIYDIERDLRTGCRRTGA